jgi:hypothetical protein
MNRAPPATASSFPSSATAALYPDRHRRCAAPQPRQRGRREVQHHQNAAGHRRGQCGGAGAGRPGRRHYRAGCHAGGPCVGKGRALVVAVNKWDGLVGERARRIREIDRKLPFIDLPRALHLGAARQRRRRPVRSSRAPSTPPAATLPPRADAHAGAGVEQHRRRWCAAGASSCAMPTRAGAIRR